MCISAYSRLSNLPSFYSVLPSATVASFLLVKHIRHAPSLLEFSSDWDAFSSLPTGSSLIFFSWETSKASYLVKHHCSLNCPFILSFSNYNSAFFVTFLFFLEEPKTRATLSTFSPLFHFATHSYLVLILTIHLNASVNVNNGRHLANPYSNIPVINVFVISEYFT